MTDSGEERAAIGLARGIGRMFEAISQASLTEFTVRSGRRADVIALDAKGRFTIVEIKTSLADFRADTKWPEYLDFCDFYLFAVPEDFPQEVLPDHHGLIVADRFDATILRPSPEAPMNAARRKSQTLRFATLAARRLRQLTNPEV
ncbi:MAG: MmcB family DNA repair protein [Rhodospirillales bacterium]|nr:MmcB family DNA repair protein [Rhodospirillales bacterium]